MQTEQLPRLEAGEYPGGIWYYEPDVAGPPVFAKHLIARRQRAHCFPALRGENRRIQRQLFSGLLANFHERGIELPVAVGLDHAEQVADDLTMQVSRHLFQSLLIHPM